ncbi:hypothetical protein M2418_000943 [Rhizobium sp. BIGb0125]|jgi:hypothetical protein|uniref:hypothetical protein n=1 Tax=Rhizobium sp. BIGb0125 TaxID=2940618 RepID=UPI0021695AD2|nr:hypothetical protein [Rhizobium sp. BIGb0125]MCS4241432.1 hypothetical protein [Rhizobium sp. BIGb0125]
MRNIENKPDRATVDLTLNEFRILNNAMNEILNGLRIRGFRARVGATRRKTDILLRQVQQAAGACRRQAEND